MSTWALELKELHHQFAGTQVLQGVNLQVCQGERLALIGPNGAGKSTLFNLISGELQPTRGHIELNGQRIEGWSTARIHRAGLARSFQVSRLFGGLTVTDNLASCLLWQVQPGYRCCGRSQQRQDVQALVSHWMQRLDLVGRGAMRAEQLSYAEQRRLELGLALAGGAQVVLLDEPTAGMSRQEARQAVELIREITVGRTLVMVEHDMDVVFDLADRVAVLDQGRILACATPVEIRANEEVQQAYLGLQPPRLNPGGAHA